MFAVVSTDERKAIRAEQKNDFSTGLVTDQSAGGRQPFVLKDYSENGLGVWTGRRLSPQSEVKVLLGNDFGGLAVDCQVVWSAGDDSSGYTSGLRIKAQGRRRLKLCS